MTEYTMKDLGYPRTPTAARYVVTMPNGEDWSVPVQLIVDERDGYYRDDKEDTVSHVIAGDLDLYEIRDWATGNLNWDDVKCWARLERKQEPGEVDWQEGWDNGEYKIVSPRGIKGKLK